MQKKNAIRAFTCALSAVCVLSALSSCGVSECSHTWGEYQYNETEHWREYTCGHTAPSNASAHADGNADGACDECGYSMKLPASEGLEFIQNNSGTNYAVKSIGACTDKDIVIPDTYEGLPVVAIYMEAFKGNTTIKSVVIPETVTVVYDYAFMECSALESVKFLGNSLKIIYFGAFLGCTGLKEINLPNGLEVIYDHAFNGCASIAELSIPDSVTAVEVWAFANCTSLRSISFSDQMTVVKESTCYGCTSLTAIDFGSGVTHVRSDAFYGCISLERLYVPKNILSLAKSFSGCGALKYVEFEITSGWKWASGALFNSHDVTNPEKNAYNMTGVWNGSSWKRETDET